MTKIRFVKPLLAAAIIAGALSAATALAMTFKFADQGDAVSMDPHSLNESLQLNITGNMYEPLVGRGKKLELVPLLATSWKQTSPTVWRFALRKDVKFHDGTPFTADDVIFSYERSKAEGSDMKTKIASLKEIKKVDDNTVEMVTNEPFPTLPDTISTWYIMSKTWCEKNNSNTPVDVRKGKENAATLKANGTGPFMLKSREPGVRTVLVPYPGYWGGKIESNITEAIFTPIKNDATRVAALVSGDIDMMEPVPLQDIDRLKATPALNVLQGPELRTIFLGMDQSRDELLFSDVKGKNPFKDKRVRQAFYQAIDETAIAKTIMRGAATPSGLMIAPGIRGFAKDLYPRLPYDAAAAKKLLADAGYPNGFEVTLDCPNNRYVNDEKICQALAAMWSQIGVATRVNAMPRATYFPKLEKTETSLYMLGWGGALTDAMFTLQPVLSTYTGKGDGDYNYGRYSNPKLDALTQKAKTEMNAEARLVYIQEALLAHNAEINHLPLHRQVIPWASRGNVTVIHLANNFVNPYWVTVK